MPFALVHRGAVPLLQLIHSLLQLPGPGLGLLLLPVTPPQIFLQRKQLIHRINMKIRKVEERDRSDTVLVTTFDGWECSLTSHCRYKIPFGLFYQ